VIEQRSLAELCLLSLVPLAVIASLAWFCEPTWSGGRALVSASYGLIVLLLLRLGLLRQRTVRIAAGSTLTWEAGIESDDPYAVHLHQGGSHALLLEGDDPARVLADARRIASAAGALLIGPEWLVERQGAPAESNAPAASSEEGLLWPAQLRTSRTALFGGLFVLVVFVGSIRAESELSLLAATLPLLTVVLAFALAAVLGKMRICIHSGPDGLRAERRGLGAPRPLLSVPLKSLRAVHAVGHPNYPERHLLVETDAGLVSLQCAETTARRVARLWTINTRRGGLGAT